MQYLLVLLHKNKIYNTKWSLQKTQTEFLHVTWAE